MDTSRLEAIKQRWPTYQKAINAKTKPQRPGTPKGGSFEAAHENARELEARIYRD